MQADETSIARSGGEDVRKQDGMMVKRNIEMPGRWDGRKEGCLSEANMLPAVFQRTDRWDMKFLLTMSSTTVLHMT